MSERMKRYLFISTHVDDAELSCGATIAKLLEQGNHVTVLTFSCVYEVGNLSLEWVKSMESLNVSTYQKNDFKIRLFHQNSNDILQRLFLVKENEYNFIFAPSSEDFHSDHATVGRCAERVFKHSNLITYTGDWNTRTKKTNYFVRVEQSHVGQKIKALSCYESQKEKPYMHPDYIWANALNNGVMCGSEYAESFYAINLIN